MVDRAKILQAVNTAIEKAPERKFSESIDITINLKNIDMAQPKNRIDETILLPHGIGEKIGICVIGKGDIVTQAKDAKVDLIIGPEEVERLGGAPREARRVASKYRYFLAEMAVMPRSEGTLVHGSVRGAGCRCRFRAARISVRLSSVCATR